MLACHRVMFCVCLWLCGATLVHAGVPQLNKSCEDDRGRRVNVQVRYDSSRPYFAEADRDSRTGRYTIYVNPELYFLGRQTQQWLYLRQCGHIVLNHRVVQDRVRGLRIEDERTADCWAARRVLQSGGSSRTLYSIERDMERVIRENRWGRVLPGPQRRISIRSC